MKNVLAVALAVLLLVDIGAQFARPRPALAQTGGNAVIILGVASSLSGCAWPSGATVTNGMAICTVSSGGVNSIALAVNGGPFTMLSSGSGGVASFNGRTGSVLPVAGDYNYSDLKNQPTKLACTTATHSNTGLVASGCVFN